MPTKIVPVQAQQTVTERRDMITAAFGSAGDSVTFGAATSAVRVINFLATTYPLEYSVGGGAWTELAPGKTIDLEINIAATALKIRRGRGAPSPMYADIVFSGADFTTFVDPDVGLPTTGAPVSGAGKRLPDLLVMGDSITAANGDQSGNVYADTWATHAALASSGKLRLVRNAGIGGNNTTQMLARFSADILAYAKPGAWLGIMAGTNDSDGITDTYPNIDSMISQGVAAGLGVFLVTPPPSGVGAIAAPTVTATPATTGGTLATGTYSYRVTATTTGGETLASTAATASVTGPTGSVVLTWPHVQGATGYKVYGRTSGAELQMATLVLTSTGCTYTDTGSVTPSGALPGSNTTAIGAGAAGKIDRVRQSIIRLARKWGLPLVDAYSILVDPATGLYKTGYTGDGTHPTPVVQRLIGQLVATTLGPYLPPHPIVFSGRNSDATHLNGNLLFLTNNGSVPSGWGPYSGAAAESMVTVAGIAGSTMQTARTDYTGRFNSSGTFTGFSAGDRIAFFGRMSVSGIDTSYGSITVEAAFVGYRKLASIKLQADTGGVVSFYFEDVAPAGATTIQFATAVAFGPVTLQVGQLGLVNLTALGIAA